MAELVPLFDVRTRSDGEVVTVSVIGEVDLATVDRLRRALASVPADGRVVCDLTRVTFFGCSGLSALLDARAAIARFEVVATGPAVLRPISVTGLANVLAVRRRPSTVDKPDDLGGKIGC